MADQSRAAGIVVYLRCRPANREASEAAMYEQRAMLSKWLAAQATSQDVLREFIEEEAETTGRPALAHAVAFCKARDAALVIVSKGAIGAGSSFDPRIASVPVIILPQPKRPAQTVIPLPAKARDEVSLFLGAIQNGRIPVYLCNPKEIALTDVTVSMSGLFTAVPRDKRMSPFGARPITFPRIEPATAHLIEERDVMIEGESIDQRHVCFTEGGEIRVGIAYFSKRFNPGFVALTFTVPPKPGDHP